MSEVQLRQAYRDKVYNYKPTWILRWGVTFFFLFLLIIIIASGFIKYPDIVPATAEVTTINPPANLISKVNGKIESVFVEEGELVAKHTVLAILESSAKWGDIKTLNQYILLFDSVTQESSQVIPHPSFFNGKLELGEVQANYAELLINYTELYRLHNSGYYEEELRSLCEKEISQRKYLSQLIQKKNLLEQQYKLADKKYQRDSIIFDKEVIPKSEYEQSYQNILQYKSVLADMNINIINSTSNLKQLRYDINKMELKQEMEKQQIEVKLKQNIRLLRSRVVSWKQNYALESPIEGIVSFTTYWSKNQNVKAGEIVLSVVPKDTMTVKVRLQFPIQNSGKVKEGQRVNIKLQNYPYQEFGMLVGHLSGISEIPNQLMYSADVILGDGLITSYGEKLPRVQQLLGNAEILTDDLSLLMRFFNPLRAVFDSHIKTK